MKNLTYSKRNLYKSFAQAAVAILLVGAISTAYADDSWNVDASGNWSSTSNWLGGTVPDGAGVTANLTFDITAARTVTIDGAGSAGSRTLGILNIGDANYGFGYTLTRANANILTFDNGASNAQINQISTSAANTISVPLVLSSNLSVNNSSLNTLTLSGGITGPKNVTLNANSLGNITVSGALNNGGTIANAGTGTNTVTISGAIQTNVTGVAQNSSTSTLVLSGTNTFTGGVTLNAGTLVLNSAASLGGTAGTFTINGGTINSTSATTLTTNNAQLWNGDFSFLGGNTLNLGTGSVTLGANRTVTTNASTLTVGGVISGTGKSLTKQGAGILLLSGASTYDGGTIANGGGLTLDFSAATAPIDNILNSGSSLTLGGSALTLNGKASTANTQTVNGLILNAGGSSATISNSATSNPTLLALGAITRNTGSTINFVQPANGVVSSTNGYTTSNTITNGILGGWATVGGTDWATKSGTNIVAYTGYTNDTWGSGINTTVTLASAPTSGSTTNSLRFNTGSFAVTLAGINTIESGGILVTSGAGASSIAGATATLRTGNGQDLIINQNSASTFTIASIIADNGAANGLTKSGTGAVTLSGANTYTGTTNLNAGTLSLTGVNTISGPVRVNAGTLSINSDAALGSVSDIRLFNGSSLSSSASLILGTGRTITLSSGGTVTTSSGTMTIAGNIAGTGALTTSSAIVLSGNNTMSGGINLSNGARLYFSNDSNIGGASSTLVLPAGGSMLSVYGTEFTSFGSHTVNFTGGNSGSFALDIQDRNNTFTLNVPNNNNINSMGASTFSKSGQGTLNITAPFTPTNTSGVGFAFNGGTTIIDSTAGGSIAPTGRLGFGGGTLKLVGKTGSATTQTTGNIYRVESGGGSIIVDNNNGTSSTTLALGDIAPIAAQGGFSSGASLSIKAVNAGTGSSVVTTTGLNTNGLVGAGRVTYTNTAGVTGFATNSTNLSGGAIAAYSGATTLPASGANGGVNYIQGAGAGTVTATQNISTLQITGGNGDSLAISSGQTLGIASSGLLYTGGTTSTDNYLISGGTLTSNDLVVHQYGLGQLTISSVIGNAGTAASRTGATDSVTNPTVITGLSSTDGLYVGATVTGTGIPAGAVIKSVDSASQITLSVAATATGTPSLTFGAVSTALTKTGSGTLVLSGVNTYAGITSVNEGVLSISNANQISTAALNLVGGTLRTTTGISRSQAVNVGGNGGTVDVSDGQTTTFSGTISNATVTNNSTSGALILNNSGAGTGILAVSGGNAFTGGVEIKKGILQLGSSGAINAAGVNTLSFGAGSIATLRMNGNNATVAGLNGSNSAAIVENGHATNASTLNVVNGGANSYSGKIQNGGVGLLNVSKNGAGALTLGGVNTYGGTTTVSGGTLLVTGTHTGAGAYTIATGGTLGGNGTITTASNAGVTLASGAKLAPGTSPGTLTLALGTGVLDVSAAASGANTGAFVFELGVNSPGTSDLLALTSGVLNIGSGVLEFADFNFTALSGFGTGTYVLFDTNSAITGSLGSALTGTVGGFSSTLAISGNDLVLNVGAIPEPSTYAMVAGGLAMLAFLRRRKKA